MHQFPSLLFYLYFLPEAVNLRLKIASISLTYQWYLPIKFIPQTGGTLIFLGDHVTATQISHSFHLPVQQISKSFSLSPHSKPVTSYIQPLKIIYDSQEYGVKLKWSLPFFYCAISFHLLLNITSSLSVSRPTEACTGDLQRVSNIDKN